MTKTNVTKEATNISEDMWKELRDLRENNTRITPASLMSHTRTIWDVPNIVNWYSHYLSKEMSEASLQLMLIDYIWGERDVFTVSEQYYVVCSKQPDNHGNFWYLGKNPRGMHNMFYGKQLEPVHFKTREEAEKWTTPETIVVSRIKSHH